MNATRRMKDLYKKENKERVLQVFPFSVNKKPNLKARFDLIEDDGDDDAAKIQKKKLDPGSFLEQQEELNNIYLSL